MLSGKRTIEYTLSSPPNLADLRQIVEETASLHNASIVQIKEIAGQRDAVYYQLTILQNEPPRERNTLRNSLAEQRGD